MGLVQYKLVNLVEKQMLQTLRMLLAWAHQYDSLYSMTQITLAFVGSQKSVNSSWEWLDQDCLEKLAIDLRNN